MVKIMVRLEHFSSSKRTDLDSYFVSFTSLSSQFHSREKQKERMSLCSEFVDRSKIISLK